MINKLTSKNLSNFIDTYPTKYQHGFLFIETNEILERFNIDKDAFYTAMGINTCMVVEGQTLNYHSDIELALRCVIENREKKLDEWD